MIFTTLVVLTICVYNHAAADTCDTDLHPTLKVMGTCMDESVCTSSGGVTLSGWCQTKPVNVKCCFKTAPASGYRLSVPFLAHVEGFRTDAYCLSPSLYPLAGVTIGIGVDFGSKTATSLRAAGVSDAIINKVSRYFGLTGQKACDAVTAYKVVLTQTEAMDLSGAIINQESSDVATKYNAAKSSTAKYFDDLTCAQKTVIASVLYQYGSPSRVPKFWTLVTTNNWATAITELRNFGDAYATRRNKEADLLLYSSTSISCPGPNSDICEATRGSCITKTSCAKTLVSNFCLNQASTVMCCV